MDRLLPDPAPVLAAGVTLALAVVARPGSVPDGPEMAAAGGCLLRLGLDASACAGVEPFFWMPAFPLLAGVASLVTDPWSASHAAAAVCTGLFVIPLAAIGRRLSVPAPAVIASALLLATPAIHALVAQSSGRALAWLAILGAVATAMSLRDEGVQQMRRGAAVGALLGLAVLSRREAVVQAALVGVVLLPFAPRAARAAFAACGLVVLPWFAALALAADGPRLGGRAWEPVVYAWDAVVPHEWLLMEISMGTWGTPLRRAVSGLTGGNGLGGLDAAGLTGWLRYALPVAVPAWLAALALGGSILLLRRRGGWRVLSSAALLGLPALPLAIAPNARAVELPAQNLHPIVLACAVPAMVAAGRALVTLRARLPGGRWSAGVLLMTVLTGASMGNAAWVAQVVPMDHISPATLAAAGADLTEGDTPVVTTLNAAIAARRGDRPRAALPSPYRIGEAPLAAGDAVLITELDLPGARRTLRALSPALTPARVLVDGEAWAVRFQVEASEPALEQSPP
ncbi:MAG: hypothetical protein VX265_02280 [Myxococcota bacterium]|nr:hypothetical protein [Myxococcota bacterium]